MQRYLLGHLTGSALEELEHRLLLEDNAFAEMLDTEEELIESYLSGGLKGTDRRRFEEAFLSSASRRERVEQHRLLRLTVASPVAENRQTGWPWSSIALVPALAAALAAAYLAVDYRQSWLRAERDLLALHSAQAGKGQTEVSYLLEAGRLRSQSKRQWIWVPPAAERVSLILGQGESPPPPRLDARLETVEGAQVWGGPCLVRGSGMVVTVPAAVLRPGDYILMLESAGASFAAYPLRVLIR